MINIWFLFNAETVGIADITVAEAGEELAVGHLRQVYHEIFTASLRLPRTPRGKFGHEVRTSTMVFNHGRRH